MHRRVVFLIMAVVATALAWLLLCSAIATERWALATATTSNSRIGDVSIKHEIGIFQWTIRECCVTHGQLVPDFKAICNIVPPKMGCAEFDVATGDLCTYFDEKQSYVHTSDTNCAEIVGSSISVIVLVVLTLLGVTAAGALLFTKIIVPLVFAIVVSFAAGLVTVALIVFSALVYDNEKDFFNRRYAPSAAKDAPVSVTFEPSFDLCIAAVVFFVFGAIFAFVSYAFEHKPAPPPVVYHTAPDHVMTPQNPVLAMRGTRSSPVANSELPVCPDDIECVFADDFGHQLQYMHTCRTPFCSDHSPAHLRHFLH
jgi:hypothetical protein